MVTEEAESAFEALKLPERMSPRCAGRKARAADDGSFLIQVLPLTAKENIINSV